MSAAFRDSSPLPLPFLFLISSAPFPFLTSHQERRASVRPVASSSPSLQIMRTSCAANKTRVAPPPRAWPPLRGREREREGAFRRICLVDETTKFPCSSSNENFRGNVDYAHVEIESEDAMEIEIGARGSNRGRIKRSSFSEYSIGILPLSWFFLVSLVRR